MNRNKNSQDEWAARAPFLDLPVASSPDAGVIACDRGGLGIASVLARRGRYEEFAGKCRQRFGVELLSGPRRSIGEDIAFIATGPNAWLATREDDANGLAVELAEALDDCAAIADQSDGQAVLRLSGPKTRETLCKLVPIDLHPRAFAVGDVAVTVAAHMGATLWRLPDEPKGHAVFEIAVYRSLAANFWTALTESAAEYGFGRVNYEAGALATVHEARAYERHIARR
ncbi:sarcosine oxidase subunit gamma [Steroidobacter flavus]|uniref:Sarcosine oxidase subunit gamma n=1 Tax=Steroidobacter flavus TaxID=1842136 RepID=A0ABV8SVJ0_9GAMM